MKKVLLHLAENGSLPDPLIRLGIQCLLQTRFEELALDDCERRTELQHDFLTNMHRFRIAEVPDKANQQHYELPAAFFQKILGQTSSTVAPSGRRVSAPWSRPKQKR